ncbi:hypothetical protein EDB80DRAFT_737334 [Ilyonectria destructans]|nr:hypothetical protein EDB80DRAFT_737334 [Ilyonectria destructans]
MKPRSLRSGPCSRILASSSVALNPGYPSTSRPIATLEYSSHKSWSGGYAASRDSRRSAKATALARLCLFHAPACRHRRWHIQGINSDTPSTPYRPARPCEVIDPASGRQVPPLITCRPLNVERLAKLPYSSKLCDHFLKFPVLYVQVSRTLNVSCALCQRAADGILFSPMHLLPRLIPILLHPNEQVDLIGCKGCSYARVVGGTTTRKTE